MTTALHEAALINEQVALALVQDWVAYLRAKLAILDTSHGSDDPFERSPTAVSLGVAEETLAALPPDRRAMFDRAVAQRRERQHHALEEERRAATHGPPGLIDPDELDRVTLRELLADATNPDASGHVLFPEGDGQRIEWLEIRADALLARPDEAAYRLVGHSQAQRERTLRIAAGAGALLLSISAVWMLLMPQPEPRALPAAHQVQVNGQPAMLWHATRLILTGDTTLELELVELDSAESASWPDDGRAYIRGQVLPLSLCAPGAALVGFREIRVEGTGVPDRVYARAAGVAPDLRIAACDNPQQLIDATLIALIQPPPVEPGVTLEFGDRSVMLAAAAFASSAESGEVPQGALRVSLQIESDQPLSDWLAYAPLLRLGDGSQQAAPELIRAGDRAAELRFLVAAPVEPLDAELRLTDPATGLSARWKLTIAPPLDRVGLLRQTLQVGRVIIAADRSLNVVVANIGVQPLALTADDVGFEWAGAQMALPVVEGIDGPLAAGERRSVTIALPPDFNGTAILRIGAMLFRITT